MKKINSRLLAYAVIPTLGLGFLGLNIASAHGLFGGFGNNLTPDQVATRQQNMFQNEATLLGISVDDVKNAWAQGKTIVEIAQDHGITKEQLQQKIKDMKTQQLKTQLQTLVDKVVITQSQADQRLQYVNQQLASGNSVKGFWGGLHSGGRGGMGMMRMMNKNYSSNNSN